MATYSEQHIGLMRLGVSVLVSVSLMRTTSGEKTAFACNVWRHRSQEESIRPRAARSSRGKTFLSSWHHPRHLYAGDLYVLCELWECLIALVLWDSPSRRCFNVEMGPGSLCAAFCWETNLEIQPLWNHTWSRGLTNNLPRYQVAVTNVSHLRKIALIVKESFTSYWEAICWPLFAHEVKDGFSILQVRVSGRERAVDDVCHTKVQAKGALMIWKGDHWEGVKGNESSAKEMHQGEHRPLERGF